MSRQLPFIPIEPRPIEVGSRVLFGHYPNEPVIVTRLNHNPAGVVSYRVADEAGNFVGHVGDEFSTPAIEWLWTPNHGIWVGAEPEPDAPHIPDFRARCFGPPLCETCAEDLELLRSGGW